MVVPPELDPNVLNQPYRTQIACADDSSFAALAPLQVQCEQATQDFLASRGKSRRGTVAIAYSGSILLWR